MQPPTRKFGEYLKHKTTFGDGAIINDTLKVHPGVINDEIKELLARTASFTGE